MESGVNLVNLVNLVNQELLQDALYGIARNKIYALVAALNPLRTRSSLGCFINILAAATAAHVLSTPGKEVLDYFLVPHGKRQPLLEFLQPARWFRDGAQHALLVGLSLAVGALATLQVEKLGTFLARQLWRRPRGLLAAGMVLVLCRLRLHSLHSLRMALLKSGTLESSGLPALLLSRAEARAEEKAVPAEEVSAEPSTQSDAEPTFPAPAGELEEVPAEVPAEPSTQSDAEPTFPAPAGELEEVPAEVPAEPSTQSDAEPTFPAPAGELEEVPAEVPAEPSTQSNAEPTSPAADKLEVQSAPPLEIPLETVDLAVLLHGAVPAFKHARDTSLGGTRKRATRQQLPAIDADDADGAHVYRSRAGLSYSSAVPVRGTLYLYSQQVQRCSGPALPVRLASNGNADISRPQTPAGRVGTAVHPPHMSHVQVMHAQVRSVPMAPVYRPDGADPSNGCSTVAVVGCVDDAEVTLPESLKAPLPGALAAGLSGEALEELVARLATITDTLQVAAENEGRGLSNEANQCQALEFI
ncbi:rsmF [Symbiodinium natans]|uniref:RsmF protein n=1 Tax=Symbiodinium natans TaxID=878477 RepID=A0A812N8W3_9DINO|nr:rsmF [Symbiodinium natans]